MAQVDDLQTASETLVPAERLPEYHHLATTQLRTEDPAEIASASEQLASWSDPAVRGVIENRLESGTSTVVEHYTAALSPYDTLLAQAPEALGLSEPAPP